AGGGGSRALGGGWLAARAVGLVAGALTGFWFVSPRRRRGVMRLAAIASLAPFLPFFASPPIAVALPLLVIAGTGSMYALGLDGLLRQAVPAHMFARTMAVNTAGLLTLQALGFPLAGAIAAITRPGPAVTLAGASRSVLR